MNENLEIIRNKIRNYFQVCRKNDSVEFSSRNYSPADWRFRALQETERRSSILWSFLSTFSMQELEAVTSHDVDIEQLIAEVDEAFSYKK